MIYISSDHGGFDLKNALVNFLNTKNMKVVDLGPQTLVPDDDFPDYTVPLVRKVSENPDNKGILICRNGVGVSIMANRFDGIRAVLSFDPKQAASSRNDDDTNVLALPADYIDSEKAKQIVQTWLTTNFSGESRFKRRLNKIKQIENL
ncbi:MAG TPA: RpiB/LacA/LacB family sugar-phosphate isomerase [Candidatus Saccharimonadales bacterium]|nr:RpiB/LacA/LacB family sugar-phosphate isomerase [Candidatus Saccharimonadales bacterium]